MARELPFCSPLSALNSDLTLANFCSSCSNSKTLALLYSILLTLPSSSRIGYSTYVPIPDYYSNRLCVHFLSFFSKSTLWIAFLASFSIRLMSNASSSPNLFTWHWTYSKCWFWFLLARSTCRFNLRSISSIYVYNYPSNSLNFSLSTL